MCFPCVKETSDIVYTASALSNLSGVTFASLNIQSVYRKFDEIKILLNESGLDCLCLQESFLNYSIDDSELHIPGFHLWRYDRTANSGKSSGGGIMMYTNSDREFSELPNSHLCTPHVELSWLKLKLKQAHDTYICNVYRPPDGSVDMALDTIKDQFQQLNIPPQSDVLIMGNINVDLLKTSANRTKVINFENEFSLSQLITSPTRTTLQSATLIDHVYANNTELYHRQGTINPGLSDHSLVFTNRKKGKLSKEKESRYIRSYKNFDQVQFDHDVATHNWHSVYNSLDVDEAVYCFHF